MELSFGLGASLEPPFCATNTPGKITKYCASWYGMYGGNEGALEKENKVFAAKADRYIDIYRR